MRSVIDSNASKLTLQVFAAGMMSSLGHNPTFAVRKFEGQIDLDDGAAATGALQLSVDIGSIELQGDFNGRDRWGEGEGRSETDIRHRGP